MQTNRSCKTSAQTIIRRAKQFVAQKQMQIKTQQTNELNESIYKLGIVCVRKQANAGSFGKFGTVFAQPFFDCYFTHCSVVITENNENKFAIYHFQFEFSSIFICRRVSPLFFFSSATNARQLTSLPNICHKKNHFKRDFVQFGLS